MKKIIICLLLLTFQHTCIKAQNIRPLWIWNSTNVVGNTSEENILFNECINSSITDLYLYSGGSLMSDVSSLRTFIARANCLTIKVWALDGWRGYYSDLCGPGEFYGNIQNAIDYNAGSASNERFVGFAGDNEFQVNDNSTGCGTGNVFHLGSKDATLSTSSGGYWQSSAKADRDSLMSDCVKQAAHAATMCHNAGIKYGIAMMPWITGTSYTSANMGNQTTPLMARYLGVTKPLYQHLLEQVDQYVVMSYHTNITGKVVYMCQDVLTYADGMSASVRPQVLSALETDDLGSSGAYVSYCNTPGYATKSYVLNAMTSHKTNMGSHVSYAGQALHSWSGWKSLSTTSSNSSNPPGSCSVTAITVDKSNNSSEIYYDASSGILTIHKSGAEGNGKITLIGTDGRELFQTSVTLQDGSGKAILPAAHPGCYIYNLSLNDGTNQNGKIIIF